MKEDLIQYNLQLSMLRFLYSKNMLTKKEFEKIKMKLRIRYTK